MWPVLEPNTNAQRMSLLSHLLRSPLYTFVQNCRAFRAVSNRESQYPRAWSLSDGRGPMWERVERPGAVT